MSLSTLDSEFNAAVVIKKQQLDILYKNQLPLLLISILAAITISAFSFIHHSGLESFAWLLVLIVVSAVRMQLIQQSKHAQGEHFNSLNNDEKDAVLCKQYRAFNIATFAAGGVWGAAPFIMLDSGSAFEQIVFIYVLGGLCAGALAGYSSSTLSFLCFTIPVILLAVFKLTLLGGGLTLFTVFMGLVYLGILTLTSIRLERYITKGLELKHATEELFDIKRNQRSELRKSAQRLQASQLSLDIAKVWTWETNADLEVCEISATFQNSTGIQIGDLLNRSIKDCINILLGDEDNTSGLIDKMQMKQVVNDYEISLARSDGAQMTLSLNAVPHYDSDNNFMGYRAVGRDISSIKNSMRKLEAYANHDSLTQLFNRRAFHEKVEGLTCYQKGTFEQFYIAYIDLDRLKIVNDTVGHICGDELLQELSRRMSHHIGSDADLARIGGDEFALILYNPSIDYAIRTVEGIIETVRDYRYVQNDSSFSVGVNIGLVPVLSSASTVTELVRYADHACFVAREKGDYGFYVASAIQSSQEHAKGTQSVQTMFDALEKDRLAINYQPIASALDGKVHFFEALLNVKDPAGTASSAGEHISVVEKYGVMAHFDRWVIRDVFRDFGHFQQQHPGASVFVNLSGSNLDDENLFQYIREQLAKYSVPRDKICFEITETAAIRNTQDAIQLIKGLRSSGCRFALDDFGTGLASLSYLKDFPVDFVKLDGTFIQNLKDNPVDQAILKAVTELGDSLGFSIIAESVEDADLIPYLYEAGVGFVQGYSVGYPKPLSNSELP